MPYLVNPHGRTVAIDDDMIYAEHLQKPGFRKATDEEIEIEKKRITDYLDKRNAYISTSNNATSIKKGIYMATVSQGGKDGYGIASSKIFDILKKNGYSISLHNEGQDVGLLFHNPYSIINMDNDYLITYTMFESDKIPEDWNYYLTYTDAVFVPSKWCQNVFAKSGIKAIVVPLGYDSDIFKYYERPIKKEKKESFKFLHYNAFNIRKGFVEVFKAFTEEFETTEPVKLILKTTLDQIPLPITKKQYPNIEIITGSYQDNELLDIIYKSDCFVFPSRGEGFGVTPLECMATGLPTIVPNAHGISEYFDSNYMYEAKIETTCPGIYSKYKGIDVGKMVICDIKQLRSQMRYIYEHQEQAREVGKKASEYVKKWTLKNTADKLIEEIEKLRANKPKKRTIKNVLQLESL